MMYTSGPLHSTGTALSSSPATSGPLRSFQKASSDSLEKVALAAAAKAKRTEKTLSDSDPVQNAANPLLHPFTAPHKIHNSDDELAPPTVPVVPSSPHTSARDHPLSKSQPLLHQKVQHLAAGGWGVRKSYALFFSLLMYDSVSE